MILACPALPHAHLQHLIDGLRPVRIVYLRTDRDSREEPADAALVLAGQAAHFVADRQTAIDARVSSGLSRRLYQPIARVSAS